MIMVNEAQQVTMPHAKAPGRNRNCEPVIVLTIDTIYSYYELTIYTIDH